MTGVCTPSAASFIVPATRPAVHEDSFYEWSCLTVAHREAVPRRWHPLAAYPGRTLADDRAYLEVGEVGIGSPGPMSLGGKARTTTRRFTETVKAERTVALRSASGLASAMSWLDPAL